MRKALNLIFLSLSIVVLTSSCVSKKKWTELLNDRDGLSQTLTETQQKVKMLEEQVADLESLKSNLEGELATATSEREKLSKEIASIKEELGSKTEELAAAQAMVETKTAENQKMQSAINDAFAPYTSSGLTLTQKGGKVYVSLSEPILFRSGSARISRADYAKIKSLAEILKANPGITILVEGHSDNAKMKTGVGYNNFDLSFNRGMAVVNRLKRYGVSPNQLSVVGRGDSTPTALGDPSDPEVRKQNRRVEFLVIPSTGNIYNLKGV